MNPSKIISRYIEKVKSIHEQNKDLEDNDEIGETYVDELKLLTDDIIDLIGEKDAMMELFNLIQQAISIVTYQTDEDENMNDTIKQGLIEYLSTA